MFSAAVRGFHFYRRAWVPTESEKLKSVHDKNNPFDNFAIKTMNNSVHTVGHLPMELSGITKLLNGRGARVEAQLSSTSYRRSPLIQGGLEIPCDGIVTIPGTIDNQLICEKHVEPKEEVIVACFLEPNVLAQTGSSTIENQQKTNVPTNRKKKADKKKPSSSYDIRSLLLDSRPNAIKKKTI